MKTHIQLVDLFWLKYPYLYVLIRIKKGERAEMLLEQFESLQEDPEQWTRYTHLYILPYFDMLRHQNKLQHVTKKVKIPKLGEVDYDGEEDENGAITGLGTATDKDGNKWYGTWLNGAPHGIRKFAAQPSHYIC